MFRITEDPSWVNHVTKQSWINRFLDSLTVQTYFVVAFSILAVCFGMMFFIGSRRFRRTGEWYYEGQEPLGGICLSVAAAALWPTWLDLTVTYHWVVAAVLVIIVLCNYFAPYFVDELSNEQHKE